MKTRLLTSLYIAIALVIAFFSRFLTLYVFDAVIGVLAVVGVVEIARVLERSKKYNSISLVGLYPAVLYAGLFFSFYMGLGWQYYLLTFVWVYVLFTLTSFILTLAMKKTTAREMARYKITVSKLRFAVDKALNTGFVLVYPSVLFISLILLNHFNDLSFVIGTSADSFVLGTFFMLLAVVITVVCDSMAMIVGMLVKGPKLAPIISPKKTISGAVGGLVFGTLSALLLYWLFGFSSEFVTAFSSIGTVWHIAVIGLVGSVLCQVGDLFASFLKRRARVKDYGTIFPGHGGVMDRVDGLIFTATVVLIFVIILL